MKKRWITRLRSAEAEPRKDRGEERIVIICMKGERRHKSAPHASFKVE